MCCPLDQSRLRLLTATELRKLNVFILRGIVQRYDGSLVTEPLEDALITINLERIYPVEDGIPVVQIFEQIETSGIPDLFNRAPKSSP